MRIALSSLVNLVVVSEEYEVDGHIAVESAELIDELFLVDIVVDFNGVYELEQSTEICSLYSSKLVISCVLAEYGLENALIVKVFGNGYLECHVLGLAGAETYLAESEHHDAEHDEEYDSKADIADTARNACSHCVEDVGDVLGVTRDASESDESECTRERKSTCGGIYEY